MSGWCWPRIVPRLVLLVLCAARTLAAALFDRGVTLETVENAFVLAASRRMVRPASAAPLGLVRSLAYFSPVIDEVLESNVSSQYFDYLRHRLKRSTASSSPA